MHGRPHVPPSRLMKCGVLLTILAATLALPGCSRPLPEAIQHCHDVTAKAPDMFPGTGESTTHANIMMRRGNFIRCMKYQGYIRNWTHEEALRDRYRKTNDTQLPHTISELYHENVDSQLYKDMDNPDSGYWIKRDPISDGCFFNFCP